MFEENCTCGRRVIYYKDPRPSKLKAGELSNPNLACIRTLSQTETILKKKKIWLAYLNFQWNVSATDWIIPKTESWMEDKAKEFDQSEVQRDI